MTERTGLGRQQAVGMDRKIVGEDKQMGRVNGSRDVDACSGAHPGADARPMHAGIVMRRVLEFMRNGIARRHRQ